jgi:hypothetical protein
MAVYFNFPYKYCWLIFLGWIFPTITYTQNSDSASRHDLGYLTDRLEDLSRQLKGSADFSDLVDDYINLSKNPVNLNGPDVDKLVQLYLINDIQLNNIRAYISNYGYLLSVHELKNIPGFSEAYYERLLPFITVYDPGIRKKPIGRRLFLNMDHSIIIRFARIAQTSNGYRLPVDSALHYPGRVYLGDPNQYYFRYAFTYRDKVRAGITMEKDAGEIITKSALRDTLKHLVGHKAQYLFDFRSGFLMLENIGPLEKIVIGDYHLEFGQGVTLWSGLSFGKSAEGMQIKRYARGIRPNTSANENRFFRGGCFVLSWKHINFTGFYSYNNIDAGTYTDPDEESLVTSLQESGKHRTIHELLKKDELNITTYGGRFGLMFRNLQLGITSFKTEPGRAFASGDQPYKYFDLSGNNLLNYGIDLAYAWNKIHLFGELSGAEPGGLAGIAGANIYLADRFCFTLSYRHYARDYINLFNNPMAETSRAQNESGFYLGFRALLAKHLTLSGYLDHFRFPWLRYKVNGPSEGRDYQLQLNFVRADKFSGYVRTRYKQKEENHAVEGMYTKQLQRISRSEFRFFISYQVTNALSFKNRLDYVHFKNQESERGYLLYQDIIYKPGHLPLQLTFRYALFSTEGFYSRIYVYENDVRYAFSVPAYSGNGQRIYGMLKVAVGDWLDIWFRLATTIYADRRSIGSGGDKIEGNTKTEAKLQVMLRF